MFAVTESSQEMLCGNMNKLNIYFEYYFHNLEVEIKERAKRKVNIFVIISIQYIRFILKKMN